MIKKRPNEIKNFICKNNLIKKEFKFKSTYSLNRGLKTVIDFYKQKKIMYFQVFFLQFYAF